VQAAVDDMDAGTFTLRLLCQYSWKPVGAGYRIQAPRDSVPKLLPLLSVGLKGMKAVCGIGSLGRMFGLPWPDMPESAVGVAEKLVDGLGSEFACVTAAAGAAAGGDSARARTAVSKFQQAEFEAFLRQHDPKEMWKAQLARVALRSGQVLWVSEASNAMLQAEGQLGAAPAVRPALQICSDGADAPTRAAQWASAALSGNEEDMEMVRPPSAAALQGWGGGGEGDSELVSLQLFVPTCLLQPIRSSFFGAITRSVSFVSNCSFQPSYSYQLIR
jgi:hypothetical protein